MQHHDHQKQCYALITETTRLQEQIQDRAEREATPSAHTCRLLGRYHDAMAQLLALRPAHDAEAKARQVRTGQQHKAEAGEWWARAKALVEGVS
ncbi:hypothetical protein SAMN04487957_110108 [Halomonas shengliensis]|uniref:Uncharacterized protein n=1 Tax=Halomonas shengliensis TaxID=419597 RepID=A0A1H0LU30_9GAMM|nr:hypothetical protein [Halomonas shengliensis]SDO71684.1 hypothetical protein SAMN04487957_110108 [Halomonas shengliensis]